MHNFKLLLKNLIKLILVLLVPVIGLASNQDNFIPFHLHNVDKSCQSKVSLYSQLDQSSDFSLNLLLYNQASYQVNSTSSDAFIIHFLPDGNNDIDLNDAPKIDNLDENLARLHSGNLLTIEERSLPDSGTQNLPIFIDQYTSSEYVFKSIIENLPDNIDVLLVDHYLGETHQLYNQESIIYFSIDPTINASKAYSHFSLSVNNTINLDTPDFEADLFTVFPNPSVGDVHITSNQPIKDVRIYKSYGKLVQQIINVKRNSIHIDFKSYSRGMYFIEITNQKNHRSTQKLLLK